MSPQIVKFIIAGLALLIIGVQVLFGAIRGLKKSTFRLIWIFAWGVICLLLSSLIAKALVNIDISFLHISVNGEEISTLPAYIQKMLESSNPDIAQAMADNPQMYELCMQIAVSVINLVVFELLFWVVKYLLYPLWAILAKVFFGKKKKAKTEERNVYIKQKEAKPKKHGLLGMLIGVASGLVVAFFAFIPLKTVSDLVVLAEAETTVEYDGATQKGIVSQYAGSYIDYVYVYEDSFVNKAFKYTGLGYVQNLGGDILLNTKHNGKSINLKNEIKTFGGAYVDYEKIAQYDLHNLTKENINEILPLANDLQTRVLSSNLVKSVYEEMAPYLVKNMLIKDNYFIKIPTFGNELLDNMVRDSLSTIFGITITETTNELDEVVKTAEIDKTKVTSLDEIGADATKALELAKTLNDNDFVVMILNNDFSFDSIQEKLTVELGEEVVNTLFDLNLFIKIVPVVVEPAIKQAISLVPTIEYDGAETKFEFTEIDGGIQTENFKYFLENSITNAIKVVKNIDTETVIYINPNDFSKLGEIIDNLKLGTVISRDTFDSGINYLTTYAKKLIAEAGLNAEIENILVTMINKVNGVGSYELELKHIGDAYQVYMGAETISLELIEDVFDELLDTYMYKSSLTEIFDYVISQIEDIDFGPLDIKDDLIAQINQDKENNVNIITILLQMEDLSSEINAIRYVPELADINRAYLINIGETIDNISTKFSLIVNEDAQRKAGEYVVDRIDEEVQASDLTAEQKQSIQEICESLTTDTSFADLFTQIADALNLE